MQQVQDAAFSSRGRFAIALVTALILHGIVLIYLTGMRMSEPRKPHIMVGMLIKSPEPKPVESKVEAAPAPAVKTAPPEPPVQKPQKQPVVESAKPKPVNRKPKPGKKPAAKAQPIEKAPAQIIEEHIEQFAQTVAVNNTISVSNNELEATPTDQLYPPQFHAEYLHNPQPRYPLISRKRREEGEVVLRVKVDAKGLPVTVNIQTSSGHSRLDRAASSAVQKWRFVPAKQGGVNIPAWVVVPIQFNLER
jgi:protein TonB